MVTPLPASKRFATVHASINSNFELMHHIWSTLNSVERIRQKMPGNAANKCLECVGMPSKSLEIYSWIPGQHMSKLTARMVWLSDAVILASWGTLKSQKLVIWESGGYLEETEVCDSGKWKLLWRVKSLSKKTENKRHLLLKCMFPYCLAWVWNKIWVEHGVSSKKPHYF